MTDAQIQDFLTVLDRIATALEAQSAGITMIAAALKQGAANAAKDPPSPAQRPVAPSGRG